MDKKLHEIACDWSHHEGNLKGIEQMFIDLMDDHRVDDGTDWYPIDEIKMDNVAFINDAIYFIKSKVNRYQSEADTYINALNEVKDRLQNE